MARTLARAGHDVILWNRTGERATALATEIGGRAATTPAQVAKAAGVCLTMLADEAAVRDVFEGRDGLLGAARDDLVLVDLGTVPPDTIRSFERAARAAGAGILDAPVSGSVATAETGGLTLMVGGEADDLERARPVLEPLAKAIFHLGPLGSGAAMKLAVNAVIFGLNNALSEALVLAESAGIERGLAYDVLAASAVGAPFVGYKRAAFLEPDVTATSFSLELAEKDLRLISDLAVSVGVAARQAETNLELVQLAAAAVGGERDFSAVATYLRDNRSGIEQRGASGA